MKTQCNFYEVVYSDGVTIIDTLCAANLKEAKQKAAEKAAEYKTAYYMVRRCWNGGVNGLKTNWH